MITKIRELLQKNDLKATPQRILIYDKMRELGHASADMVYQEINSQFPAMTIATVYNTLEQFVDKGLLKRRMSSTNKMFFDYNTFPHCHLYCREDDSYIDYLDNELIDMITNYVRKKKFRNFEWSEIDIQIIGKKKNNKK